MKKFIVIGIYTDNFQRFATDAVAEDWVDAMNQVASEYAETSLAIVEVIDENFECCTESSFVESCEDIAAGTAEVSP